MALLEFTYKGRRIWIDPYRTPQGWRVIVEVWEVGREGTLKDEIRLPANVFFRSLRSARTFAERMTKRGIDRRQEQEETVSTFTSFLSGQSGLQ
jgi:hypothetical protein